MPLPRGWRRLRRRQPQSEGVKAKRLGLFARLSRACQARKAPRENDARRSARHDDLDTRMRMEEVVLTPEPARVSGVRPGGVCATLALGGEELEDEQRHAAHDERVCQVEVGPGPVAPQTEMEEIHDLTAAEPIDQVAHSAPED